MLGRLTLTLACWSLCAQAATAEPIRFTCRVAIEITGEMEGRTVDIDPKARIVQDNSMTFTDSATSPLAASIEEFVTIESRRATWGNRSKIDWRVVGTFTVDLLTGGYTFVSRSIELADRGTCHGVHAAHCTS